MGTENDIRNLIIFAVINFNKVKLNNPQMGTENLSPFLSLLVHIQNVKLNNPQMGTEKLDSFNSCINW